MDIKPQIFPEKEALRYLGIQKEAPPEVLMQVREASELLLSQCNPR